MDYERQKARGQQSETTAMSGRPRNRGLAGRDGARESDVEADLLARIIDGIKQVQKHNDESKRIGEQIMALEEEIKNVGRTLDVFCPLLS